MIPENGVFVYINHVSLTTTPFTVPENTTHIVVCTGNSGTLLQDEAGILGFRKTNVAANEVIAIPCGEFVRLFTNITPGVSQLFKTTAVGGIVPNIDQVSFYRWEIL
jgi:hypothetical protein